MLPRLKSVGLALALFGSGTIAPFVTVLNLRAAKLIRIGSPVLAQSITIQDRKAEGNRNPNSSNQPSRINQQKADLRLYQQATEQYRKGRYRDALKTAQQALKQYRQLKQVASVGQTLNLIAEIYVGLDPGQKTLPILQEALTIHRRLGDRRHEAEALNSLGAVYAILNQSGEAFATLKQALAIQRSINDRSGEALTLSRIGLLTVTVKKDPQGLELLQQALSMQQEAADQFQIGFTLWRIGQAYWSLKKIEQAMNALKAALTANRQSGNIAYEAMTLQGMGFIDMDAKKFDQAIDVFLKALTLFQRAGMRSAEGFMLETIGLVHSQKSQTKAAIPYLEKALPLIAESSDQNQFGDLLSILANSYFEVGDRPRWLTSYQKAITVYQQTKNDSSRLGMLLQVMNHYYLFGSRQKEDKAYTAAIADLNQVLAISPQAVELAHKLKQLDDVERAFSSQSASYSLLSGVYAQLGDLPKAKAFADRALVSAQQAKNLRDENGALAHMVIYYKDVGNYPQRLAILQRSLIIARQLNTPFDEAQALSGLTSAYSVLGDTPKFMNTYPLALAKAAEINIQNLPKGLDNESIITLKFNLLAVISSGYWTLGQNDKALDYAQQKLQLARTSSKREREVEALIDVGQIQNLLDSKLAQATFEQALVLSNELNQPMVKAEVLVHLSEVVAADDPQRAIDLAQQALPLVRTEKARQADRTRFVNKESDAINALSKAYKARGDYTKALALLQESVAISQKSKNPDDYEGALIDLGEFYDSLGDYASAAKQFQQARVNAQKTQQVGWDDLALFLLAENAFLQGKPETAIALAQEKLALAERYQSRRAAYQSQIIFYLGYAELGDQQKALSAAQAGLDLARQMASPSLEQEALAFIGHTYRRFGEWNQALTYYQSALTVKELKEAPDIYMGLAQVYAHRNQPEIAISFYKQAVNSIEKTRRKIQGLPTDLQKSFLQATFDFGGVKTADIYRQLADVLISQGRLSEAENVLALLKEQEIKDFTQPTRSQEKPPEVALNDLEKALIAKHTSLIAFSRKLKDCGTQVSEICRQLRQELKQQMLAFDTAIVPTEKAVKDRCHEADEENCVLSNSSRFRAGAQAIIQKQPGTLVISPLVLENKVWILVAADGNLLTRFEATIDRRALGNLVLKLRQHLEDHNSNVKELQALSHQLYQRLIAPIETEIIAKEQRPERKITNLVFALDRVTRYIPIGVLFDGKQYLAEKYTISTVLSPEAPENVQGSLPKTVDATSVLAMGVSQATTGFSALQNVPQELAAIVRQTGIYPGEKVLDRQFTRQSLEEKLPGHQILHIATHGEFVSQKNASFLLLGDGKFPISEIRALNPYLQGVNLVVLSACQTALGSPEDEGIEIPGVSSYFLTNGAKSVVASLWSVDDASTSLIMKQFYKNLATGRMTKAEALRQAQLSLLQHQLITKNALKQRASAAVKAAPAQARSQSGNFSHPYYWAPFILIGNGL